MIIPTAEPFFFSGGPIGCLLVHGFTGTPKEMRWLGEYLHKQSHSVLGVRLAGHATSIADLQRTQWEDWLASVEDGYCYLSGVADQIYVIGLSLGGILSLTFASGAYTPGCPVAGVVAMATPASLPINPHLVPALKVASLFKKTNPKPPSDWVDKEAEKVHIAYPFDSVHGGQEVNLLLYEMITNLPDITAPALLVYSKDDHVVTPEAGHADLIYERLGSPHKRLEWIEGSGHVMTRDAQREKVFGLVGEFVKTTEDRPSSPGAAQIPAATALASPSPTPASSTPIQEHSPAA
jgi:carboxylesterase